MNFDGTVYWYKQFGKARLIASDVGSSYCTGVTYQQEDKLVTIVVEFSLELNQDNRDVYLIQFSEKFEDGEFDKAQKILKQNFYYSNPTLVPFGLYYQPDTEKVVFAGHGLGYATKYQ